jgi:hypothetical protein
MTTVSTTTLIVIVVLAVFVVTIFFLRQRIAVLLATIRDYWGVRLGYVVIIVYGLLVAVAFAFIPRSASDVRFTAARYLDKNTRLDDRLLIPPPIGTLDERLRLARQRDRLLGRYVKDPIPSGRPIKSKDLLAEPDLSAIDAAVVDLAGEPDLALLNQGAKVAIVPADNSPTQHASVVAVVKSGDKWLALVRKSDLTAASLGMVKEVRLEALPAHSP